MSQRSSSPFCTVYYHSSLESTCVDPCMIPADVDGRRVWSAGLSLRYSVRSGVWAPYRNGTVVPGTR